MAEETKKRVNKRDRILQTASEVFARYGYDKTTLDDIGKKCGLNKASLYYYFSNKEDIYVQVIMTETTVFINDLQAQTASIISTADKIRHYLIERVKRYEAVLNLTQLSFEALQKVEPLFQELYVTVREKEVDFLESLLQAGIEAGEIVDTHTARELAESFFLVSDAIKHDRQTQSNLYRAEAQQHDYAKIEQRLSNIIQWIFKGLAKD
ncbi:MAG: TetR/AcrR family transcriptional regulator [Saprospiraceae bacterium]|nr:TetR/AcrR family transcriptional regulator [Saprospiraceae bacterium]